MPKSRLPDLIEKAKAAGLSLRDIRRRGGGQIPISTISNLHKGNYQNLTVETILELAKGIGESPTVVFEALIGKSATSVKDESLRQLLEDFASLPARDREDLSVLIDSLKQQVQARLDRDA